MTARTVVHTFSCLALASSLIGCGGARSSTTEPIGSRAGVALELRANADRTGYLVPVRVNDQAFLFQVDTGASGSTITPAACKKARASCGDGSASAVGAGGEMSVPTTNVLLQLGQQQGKTIELAVMDLPSHSNPPADGIIGRDVFGDSVVELGFTSGQLVLGAAAATSGVPFVSLLDSLIQIPATLDGTTIKAVVDVGASHSILNPLAAAKLGGTAPSSSSAAAVGADGKATATGTVIAKSLDVAGRTLAQPTLFVADLPVFATLGLQAEPAMILGLDVLAQGSLVIDYGKHTIAMNPKRPLPN